MVRLYTIYSCCCCYGTPKAKLCAVKKHRQRERERLATHGLHWRVCVRTYVLLYVQLMRVRGRTRSWTGRGNERTNRQKGRATLCLGKTREQRRNAVQLREHIALYYLSKFFSCNPVVFRVDLLWYKRQTTDKREQYDWRALKNLDGCSHFVQMW